MQKGHWLPAAVGIVAAIAVPALTLERPTKPSHLSTPFVANLLGA
jgi:hypothetical protein